MSKQATMKIVNNAISSQVPQTVNTIHLYKSINWVCSRAPNSLNSQLSGPQDPIIKECVNAIYASPCYAVSLLQGQACVRGFRCLEAS